MFTLTTEWVDAMEERIYDFSIESEILSFDFTGYMLDEPLGENINFATEGSNGPPSSFSIKQEGNNFECTCVMDVGHVRWQVTLSDEQIESLRRCFQEAWELVHGSNK